MERNLSLEERIQKLEDIEAIKRLQSVYGDFVNAGWNNKVVNFEKLKDIFTTDAIWKCTAMNIDVKGIEQIIDMLKLATKDYDLGMHSFTNPIINIDGLNADAEWLLWVGVRVQDTNNLVYQSENVEYIKIDNKWFINKIDLHFAQLLK